MKRIFGAVLMLASALSLYFFVSRGMFHGRELLASEYDPALPFRTLGRGDFPANALLLLGALWGAVLGLWFIVTDNPGTTLKGGKIARLLLLNALLLVSSLFVGFVGGRAGADPLTVAVFGIVAAAQILLGLILLVLALFERPKGAVSLAVGTLVWLGGTAVGVLVILWGQGGGA
ncbi:MAG TPA: hypothetical protein VEJ18_11760 [Planctomycetota bacterium]|nr:hypothetical protein [Planctomycetota bacterium]